MRSTGTIDRVWMHGAAEHHNPMTLEAFLELSPALRARLIVEGTVDFIEPLGTLMPLGEALHVLRDSWAPGRPAAARRAARVETNPTRQPAGEASPSASRPDDIETRSMRAPSERRRHVRHRVVRPLRVIREDSPNERVGVAQDVSEGGLCFRSRSRYRVGDRLIVGWSSSLGDVEETWRRGVVVRSDFDTAEPARVFPRSVAIAFDTEAAA